MRFQPRLDLVDKKNRTIANRLTLDAEGSEPPASETRQADWDRALEKLHSPKSDRRTPAELRRVVSFRRSAEIRRCGVRG